MCYTGKCRYEVNCGESAGECVLLSTKYLAGKIPDDALCVIREKELDHIPDSYYTNEEIKD